MATASEPPTPRPRALFPDLRSGATHFVLFDGGVGSELARRGADLRASIIRWDDDDEYWTGQALVSSPAIVRQVHEDYANLGVDVLTTNSFAIHRTAVETAGCPLDSRELSGLAVHLARQAQQSAGRDCLIAGSIGPVEYRRDRLQKMTEQMLWEGHRERFEGLLEHDVDLLLFETMTNCREACVLSHAARAAAIPHVVSFTVDALGEQLPSGEFLTSAIEAVLENEPSAILVNHCEVVSVTAAVDILLAVTASGIPVGAQPHLPKAGSVTARVRGIATIAEFVAAARAWMDRGATVIGGCCGVSPPYIRALARLR